MHCLFSQTSIISSSSVSSACASNPRSSSSSFFLAIIQGKVYLVSILISHWHRNRGAGPHTQKKGGPAPYLAPLLFMVHLFLPCPQYINLSAAILRQTALPCQGGHFRVLENEKFLTLCEDETPPTPSPTQSLHSLVCVAPHF